MTAQDTEETRVIFRRFCAKPREVIAFFPDIPASVGATKYVSSYMHVGQHGAAVYPNDRTKPADVSEPDVAALKRELEGIGYNLRIIKRNTRKRS